MEVDFVPFKIVDGREAYFVPFKIVDGREVYQSNRIRDDPQIFISSQLLIDKSDIGKTIFYVISKVENIFDKSYPKIVNVLKGEGKTMWDKVNNLYITYQPEILGLDFLSNVIQYSMLKYILGELLYGEFDKKYILNKYNDQLLKDLKNSEYKNFLPFFTTSEYKDYYKYFLFDYSK